jgi:hypothetical protein
MVYIKGQVDPPAQILVVVVEENGPSLQVKITESLKSVLSTNCYMDVMESHLDPGGSTG